jgi:excinuclease ABC subunit C
MVDGGEPQMTAAKKVLAELGLDLPLLSIAENGSILSSCGSNHKVQTNTQFYLERLRDEAHRFANKSHRAKRSREMFASPLDSIEGIGPAKKRTLLNYFGSIRNIEDASPDELTKVDGISKSLADIIYKSFH